jgi:hypothetical protein
VLALRDDDGTFRSHPSPDSEISAGQVIIAIGTDEELVALGRYVEGADLGR